MIQLTFFVPECYSHMFWFYMLFFFLIFVQNTILFWWTKLAKMCWLTVIILQRYSFQNGGHFYIKITVVK